MEGWEHAFVSLFPSHDLPQLWLDVLQGIHNATTTASVPCRNATASIRRGTQPVPYYSVKLQQNVGYSICRVLSTMGEACSCLLLMLTTSRGPHWAADKRMFQQCRSAASSKAQGSQSTYTTSNGLFIALRLCNTTDWFIPDSEVLIMEHCWTATFLDSITFSTLRQRSSSPTTSPKAPTWQVQPPTAIHPQMIQPRMKLG